MRAVCISATNCQYKSDTGYCGYTGNGCAQGLVRSVKYDNPTCTIVRQVELSDESVEKIADALIKKLLDYIVIPGGIEKW